jgi:hypothetical protein
LYGAEVELKKYSFRKAVDLNCVKRVIARPPKTINGMAATTAIEKVQIESCVVSIL